MIEAPLLLRWYVPLSNKLASRLSERVQEAQGSTNGLLLETTGGHYQENGRSPQGDSPVDKKSE